MNPKELLQLVTADFPVAPDSPHLLTLTDGTLLLTVRGDPEPGRRWWEPVAVTMVDADLEESAAEVWAMLKAAIGEQRGVYPPVVRRFRAELTAAPPSAQGADAAGHGGPGEPDPGLVSSP